jgi:hypothetical protein
MKNGILHFNRNLLSPHAPGTDIVLTTTVDSMPQWAKAFLGTVSKAMQHQNQLAIGDGLASAWPDQIKDAFVAEHKDDWEEEAKDQLDGERG